MLPFIDNINIRDIMVTTIHELPGLIGFFSQKPITTISNVKSIDIT